MFTYLCQLTHPEGGSKLWNPPLLSTNQNNVGVEDPRDWSRHENHMDSDLVFSQAKRVIHKTEVIVW